jgi:hypothetical protein
MDEYNVIWEPIEGIDFPCAGLSFSYASTSTLRVLMHVSRIVNGPPEDLELIFPGVIAQRWTDEALGSIFERTCGPMPKCRSERWSDWTYPLLTVRESSWLSNYQSIPGLPGVEGCQHFALICMNDLLDVLALPDVEARWVPPA